MVTINILKMAQNFHFSDTAGPTLAGWITDALGFPWTMAICGATSAFMVNYKLSFTSHYGNKQHKYFAPILLFIFSFIQMYVFVSGANIASFVVLRKLQYIHTQIPRWS